MSKPMRDLKLAEVARLSIEYVQDRATGHVKAEHAARGRSEHAMVGVLGRGTLAPADGTEEQHEAATQDH